MRDLATYLLVSLVILASRDEGEIKKCIVRFIIAHGWTVSDIFRWQSQFSWSTHRVYLDHNPQIRSPNQTSLMKLRTYLPHRSYDEMFLFLRSLYAEMVPFRTWAISLPQPVPRVFQSFVGVYASRRYKGAGLRCHMVKDIARSRRKC